MNEILNIITERVDDIPLLLEQMQRMGLPTLLDAHFPIHGNWQGLSLGWVSTIWLSSIVSRGDHRLVHVESWVAQRLWALGATTRQINYHPQSGWFEDAPLKGGAVVGCPLQRALLWHAPTGGAVAGSPLRGHCCRMPPQGAEALPGPALCLGFPYFRGAKSPNASRSARFSCSS